jgi:NodT family efflux transporter outer membrane factor (OMF) lipoprotein
VTNLSLERMVVVAALAAAGCAVGPDYEEPAVPAAEVYRDTGDDSVERAPADLSTWWTVFQDPVLTELVQSAVRDNPSLHAAAVRILEAQSIRGVAIGLLFPQEQNLTGSYTLNRLSEERANFGGDPTFQDYDLALGAAWELDIWGRFRRGIEAADAEVLATLANYDDVLVTLIADVASNYMALRTIEERLAVARSNVVIQTRALDIARARFEGGTVTELDAAQAASLLRQTESLIPSLEAGRRQAENALCVLLGLPPTELQALLAGNPALPAPPATVAVGIPADLIRRRPDVRRLERQVAAQSARIGIARADLYPAISLVGSIGVAAEDAGDLFTEDSIDAFGGPTFRWPVLNYGRITNNILAEDARFQALVLDYRNLVLRVQGEVESGISGYLGAQRQAALLGQGVAAARRAVEIAELQYRGGTADYTRVLNTQQFLAEVEDLLAVTRGQVALNLVGLYRALGGGWEMRSGQDLLPEPIKEEMRERSNWGSALAVDAEEPEQPSS